MWSYKVGVVSLLVPEVLAQVNGPCEDAVAAACPGLSGDECNTCGLANEATISPSCDHFPHDMTEACGATPSPTPSPEPTPTPSPPAPTPTPSPPTPTPTPSPPTPTPTPSPSPPGTNTINPTTDNCDDLDSCSPTSFCSKVSNEACSFPEPSIDIAGEIESLGCRQCTQASVSEHPICSADALKSTLVTPSGIQAAFCNDKYLVIHANGMPNHETHLDLVPRPPGGGGSGGYDDQCVTRSFVHQFQTFKIPLEYSLLADGNSNTVYGKLPDMDLPQSGAIGVTVNGIPLYPNEDNRGETVQQACEADRCMAHVGMGADYHYHGDPFGASCLYNEESYTGSHPAIIGWGSDGPTIYGRYTSKSQDGTDVALDDCGGHAHGSLPYHYHPNVVEMSSSSESDATFEAYSISPLNCWKGDISGIENFWEGTHQINYDNSFTSPPYTPSKRSDAQQIQPCCSSTEYYTASGISLPLSVDEMFA